MQTEIEIRYRPLQWGGPETPAADREEARFTATHNQTLTLLDRELYLLDATGVIVQIDIAERSVRADGSLKEGAVVGRESPGVILSFGSVHGPMRYATDKFRHWKDNLRAIAKSLEGLRMIDRYGVSGSGQQYKGWKAIETSYQSRPVQFADADYAEEWLRQQLDRLGLTGTLRSGWKTALRLLKQSMHPDKGGDPADFERLDEAERLMKSAGTL
jgi:hypothetical protein